MNNPSDAEMEMIVTTIDAVGEMARRVEALATVLRAAIIATPQPETAFVRVPAIAFERFTQSLERYATESHHKITAAAAAIGVTIE
jgi:hypothetical protein